MVVLTDAALFEVSVRVGRVGDLVRASSVCAAVFLRENTPNMLLLRAMPPDGGLDAGALGGTSLVTERLSSASTDTDSPGAISSAPGCTVVTPRRPGRVRLRVPPEVGAGGGGTGGSVCPSPLLVL